MLENGKKLISFSTTLRRYILNYLYAISSEKAKFSISEACDITTAEYGLLTGYGFSATFVVTGLFMGRAADRYNRRNIIAAGALIWNISLAGMGTSASFWELLVYRLLLGFGQAFSNPASYSLISDVFPPLQSAKANGAFASGVYIGGGLASISEKAGEEIGWRWTMWICAIVGGSIAVLLLVTIPEPLRKGSTGAAATQRPPSSSSGKERSGGGGRSDADGNATRRSSSSSSPNALLTSDDYEPTTYETLRFLLTDPHTATLLAAAAVRFMGGYAIAGYLPTFYTLKFSAHTAQYSIINAFVVAGGGFVSSNAGGYLTTLWLAGDRWGANKANYYVPAIGAVGGIPFMCLCLLSSDFYVSLCVGLLFEYLVAECWFGPYMSALQGGVPKTMRAMAVSVMIFIGTFFGSLISYLIGVIQDAWLNDVFSIKVILLATVVGSYTVSAWLFVAASALQPAVGPGGGGQGEGHHGKHAKNHTERSALLSIDENDEAEDSKSSSYEVA